MPKFLEGETFPFQSLYLETVGGISSQTLSQQEGWWVIFPGLVPPWVHPKLDLVLLSAACVSGAGLGIP